MSVSSKEPVRLAIGVVGLGRIGRQHALNALHYVPRTTVLAACSPAPADLAWAEEHLVPHGVKLYANFEELLEHQGLQALLIASTTVVHHEQVIAGMANGLHVLVEKPLAMNSEQSRKIMEYQLQHTTLKVMTAFSRRFDRSYQNAITAIEQGRIGNPIVVRCDNRDKYDRSEFYMRYIMKNPGIFIDTGVHDIDLTLSFFGSKARPKSCYGVGTRALHNELAEIQDVDNAVGTVEWYPLEEGTPAPISYYYISRIMQHGFDNPTEIIGSKGVIKVNLNPRRDLLTIADENGIGNDVPPDFYERYEHAFVKELSVFADCVLDNQDLPYELDVAVKGMEIAEALQESLRSGKKIEWDENGVRINSCSV